MFTLQTADTIAGVASAASKLTITIFGMELNGSTETYKVLYQGQLPSSATTIYTVPASNTAFVKTITVVNTDTVDQTFTIYRGGTSASNQITPNYSISSGGSAVYEDGIGWSTTTVQAGSVQLNDVHSGYSDYQAISNPSTPGSGIVRVWGRSVAGRMLLKFMGPAGVDNPIQPALFGNNIVMYYPTSSTNGGTATLGTFGIAWTAGGTVSHPTPASGVYTQIHRTQYSNVVTTTNQTLGIIATAAGLPQFYRGNAAGLGGFFFFCRFGIELKAADTTRLFVGLTSLATAMTAGDVSAATGDFCGIAHDTADGANVLWFITRNNTTTHKTTISGFTYGAGQGYDFYMHCKPNDSTIYYRLDDINSGTTVVDTSETNNVPRNTVMMGPQITMSNGTANVTATTTAIAIARVYVESDH